MRSALKKIPGIKRLIAIKNRINQHIHLSSVYVHYYVRIFKLRWSIYIIKKKNNSREIIAISLIEHFGDIVACEPIVRYVRDRYPSSYIVWLVRKPYRELIETNPLINEVIVVKCLTESILLLDNRLFDEAIDLHFQDRGCPTCGILLKRKSGNADISFTNYYDYGNLLAVFCQVAGLPILNDRPNVHIPANAVHRIDALHLPEKYIVVHCTSNEKRRDWSTSKWEHLIRKIKDYWNMSILEIGSVPMMKSDITNGYRDLCGELSILETAEVIRRSQLFIGVDSGPAHLANAVKKEAIILLGRKYLNVSCYIPYSGKHEANFDLIYADALAADVEVEQVFQAVQKRLSGIINPQ